MRSLKDHINIRISHSGSKVQQKGESRNTSLQDPCVSVVVLGPIYEGSHSFGSILGAPEFLESSI